MTRLWLVLLLLGLNTMSAVADGDIVFSADYYLPPGNKGTSDFHLYRINPDGTGRRQITFGHSYDVDPHWSADGTWILFTRYHIAADQSDDHPMLCCVSAQGGPVIPVMRLLKRSKIDEDEWGDAHWLPHGHTLAIVHSVDHQGKETACVYLVDVRTKQARRFPGLSSFDSSPDGCYAVAATNKGYRLYDLKRGTFIPIPDIDQYRAAIWLDNQSFAALVPREKGSDYQYYARIFTLDGHHRLLLPNVFDSDQFLFASLLPAPKPLVLIYSYNAASPSWSDYQYFTVDLKTGKMRYLTHGQFLAIAPDGHRFCTALQRSTTPYAKRRFQLSGFDPKDPGGKYRMVYYSPLYLHDIKSGRMHQITPRLSWVTAADWRKAGH